MGFYLAIVLILGVAVTAVVGLPSGAPMAACDTITPNHGNNTANAGPVPYTVDISSLDDGYTPGGNYSIVLSGTDTNADFRGFLVQARVVADNTATGTFTDYGDDQQVICTNTSVTHVNNNTKTMVELVWYAPSMGTGPILFRYAFVDNFTVFWANQTTDMVDEITDGTMTTPSASTTPGDGATGMMAASSVILMLLASIITLIN